MAKLGEEFLLDDVSFEFILYIYNINIYILKYKYINFFI